MLSASDGQNTPVSVNQQQVQVGGAETGKKPLPTPPTKPQLNAEGLSRSADHKPLTGTPNDAQGVEGANINDIAKTNLKPSPPPKPREQQVHASQLSPNQSLVPKNLFSEKAIIPGKQPNPVNPQPDPQVYILKKANRELESAKKDLASAEQSHRNAENNLNEARKYPGGGQTYKAILLLNQTRAQGNLFEQQVKVLKADLAVLKASPNAEKTKITDLESSIKHEEGFIEGFKKIASSSEELLKTRLKNLKEDEPENQEEIRQLEIALGKEPVPSAEAPQQQNLPETAPKQTKDLPKPKASEIAKKEEAKKLEAEAKKAEMQEKLDNKLDAAKELKSAKSELERVKKESIEGKDELADRINPEASIENMGLFNDLVIEADRLDAKCHLMAFRVTKAEMEVLKASSNPNAQKLKQLESEGRAHKKDFLTTSSRVVNYDIKQLDTQIKETRAFIGDPSNRGKKEELSESVESLRSLIEKRQTAGKFRENIKTTMAANQNFKPLPLPTTKPPLTNANAPTVDRPMLRTQPLSTQPGRTPIAPRTAAPTVEAPKFKALPIITPEMMERGKAFKASNAPVTSSKPQPQVTSQKGPAQTAATKTEGKATAPIIIGTRKTESPATSEIEAAFKQQTTNIGNSFYTIQKRYPIQNLAEVKFLVSVGATLSEHKNDKAASKEFIAQHSDKIKSAIEACAKGSKYEKQQAAGLISDCFEAGYDIKNIISQDIIDTLANEVADIIIPQKAETLEKLKTKESKYTTLQLWDQLEFHKLSGTLKEFVVENADEIKLCVESNPTEYPRNVGQIISECLKYEPNMNFNLSQESIDIILINTPNQTIRGTLTENLKPSPTIPVSSSVNTAEKTNEVGSEALPRNLRATETKQPESTTSTTSTTTSETTQTEEVEKTEMGENAQKAFEAFKVHLFNKTKEIAFQEKQYLAKLDMQLALKELFMDPNSPEISGLRNLMTPDQQKEFDQICNELFKSGNLEIMRNNSQKFNDRIAESSQGLEEMSQRLKEIDNQLQNSNTLKMKRAEVERVEGLIRNNPEMNAAEKEFKENSVKAMKEDLEARGEEILKPETEKQLIEERAALRKKGEAVSIGIAKAFMEFNTENESLINACAKHMDGANKFIEFMSGVKGGSEAWANFMKKFVDGKDANYQSIVLADKNNPFISVMQVNLKYPLFASDLDGILYKASKEMGGFKSEAAKPYQELGSNTLASDFAKYATALNSQKKYFEEAQPALNLSRLIQTNADPTGRLTGEKVKPSGRQRMVSVVGRTTKSQISDAQALKYTRETLKKGIDYYENLNENKSTELNKAIKEKDTQKQEKIKAEMNSIQEARSELIGASSKLEDSPWAKKIDSLKIKVETVDVMAVKIALNKHDLPETTTIKAETTPLSEMNALHEEEKKLLLSLGPEKQTKLQGLEKQAQEKIDDLVSDIIASGKEVKTSADIKPTEAELSRINQEVKSLENLVREHPELESNYKALKGHLEGTSLTPASIKQISQAVQMIENAVIHKMEMAALKLETDKAKLDQIKTTLEEAAAKDKKLTLSDQGIVETKRHQTDILGISTIRVSEGKSDEAKATVRSIVETLKHVDPSLKGKASKIAETMLNDHWVKAVLKHDPQLASDLKACVIFADKLLKGDTELQRAFLTSYRGDAIATLTGDKKKERAADSEKLFSYLINTFNDQSTTLDQKTQLIRMAIQWVEDPFINSGDVANPTVQKQIGELAKLASESPSSTLGTLGDSLKVSLEKAMTVKSKTTEFKNGTESIQTTIEGIANGKPEPGSEEYKKAVKDFAASLTAQSASTLTSITSSEFRNTDWVKPAAEAQAPNLVKALKGPNMLAHFVESSILYPTPSKAVELEANRGEWQKQSAKVYEFFVHVEQELLSSDNEIVNFQDAMAIQAGLNAQAINRLTEVRALVPSETIERFQSTEQNVLNPMSSFKSLRDNIDGLKSKNHSYIPYAGAYLGDYTMVNEGNKTANDNGSLNSDKIPMLGKAVNDLCNVPQNVVSAASNQAHHNMQEIPELESKYNNELNYNASLALQPRK